MCNLIKEKMYLFSFSLSHMLTMFLSIFSDCISQLKLSLFCVLLSLELTQKLAEYGSLFQLSVSASAHCSVLKAEWPLFSFFPSF